MIGRVENELLQRDWTTVSLKAIVTKLVDGSHNPPSKRESGVPMLSARNILNSQIVFEEYRLISEEDFEREHMRTRISPGDVLLTIVGTIGRSAVVPTNAKRFALQRSVAVMTPAGVFPKYLMYQFQAPFLQRHFENHAQGTAQKGVYLKTLGQTPILVAPLGQQERIVAEIENWLASGSRAHTFAFGTICDVLGFDPKAVRQAIKDWTRVERRDPRYRRMHSGPGRHQIGLIERRRR